MLLIWKYCRRKRLTHTHTLAHSIWSWGQIQKIRRYKIVEKRHKKAAAAVAASAANFYGARIQAALTDISAGSGPG